ncbi:hypothetical protein QLQ09_06505 [Brucella sp. NM4]|uniref:hypothetical protein n=1 Tax=Brucella/Ochrobactrum group TaxID=2826938 RepID=UPI0024BC984C|nr:hypothetical protein [Brucella sp. NM4]WHS31654.1 hypothetical protein QLQ09_06505 [Brucella sp. NM4]WHT41870.1 hypothetical protein QLQ11_10895 [Ochrobactrum sp. SSR]
MSLRESIDVYKGHDFIPRSNYKIQISSLEYYGVASEIDDKVRYVAFGKYGGVFNLLISNDDLAMQIKLNTVISIFTSSKEDDPYVLFFLNYKSDSESVLVDLWY